MLKNFEYSDKVIFNNILFKISPTNFLQFGIIVNDLIKFIIDQFPFGVNNLLEIFWVTESDLSAVLFSLKLKLDIKSEYLRVIKRFWLLLKSCI